MTLGYIVIWFFASEPYLKYKYVESPSQACAVAMGKKDFSFYRLWVDSIKMESAGLRYTPIEIVCNAEVSK